MSNLNKLNFSALEVSGRNYLKWVQDVKLHLTTKGIRAINRDPFARMLLLKRIQPILVAINYERIVVAMAMGGKPNHKPKVNRVPHLREEM
ncbi:hypothetical protein ACFX12_003274 [Malus domestica]